MKWKWVVRYRGYYKVSDTGLVKAVDRTIVYSDGRVYNYPERLLSLQPWNEYGHLCVGLSRNRETLNYAVHLLVLEAFVGPCPASMECRHLDGNPANNKVDNLCWGTKQENQADRIVHGTDNRGDKHPLAKLNTRKVLKMRRLYSKKGYKIPRLARLFKVSYMTAYDVIRRRKWKHV